jgi:TldD protein
MLEKSLFERLLTTLLQGGADYCDVFAEQSAYNQVTSDDRKINTSRSIQSGVGLRAVKDRCTYYTFCQNTAAESLIEAAKFLAAGLKVEATRSHSSISLEFGPKHDPIRSRGVDPEETSIENKYEIVRESQETAWTYSDKVSQVTARYDDFYRDIAIACSDRDEIVRQKLGLVELLIIVYASDSSSRQMGWAGKSFYKGMNALTGEFSPDKLARDACEMALTMLEADECPRGEVPVVFAPGDNGILFHESCGHGMEADLVDKGSSFAELRGEMVASEKVTIHDNGKLEGYPGSYEYDDESVPSQDTVLINKGRLESFLHSRISAEKHGDLPTGSGRRQNFKFPPLPRMRNTYIDAGDDDPDEIIRSTKKGIYAANTGLGGEVDPVTGRFITSILLGYLIEGGKLTRPVKGATITGIGIQALRDIDMVGNDLVINYAPGRCGKGQEVPVGVGMPTVRVKKLMVGGTGSSF